MFVWWTTLALGSPLAVGATHACVLRAGTPYCWGALPLDAPVAGSAPAPVLGLPPLSALTAGVRGRTCGLSAEGHAWCWAPGAPPVKVSDRAFLQLSTSGHHTCGRTIEGQVWCWGANFRGQLGDGTTTDRETEARVANLTARSITTGLYHTCAHDPQGKAWCWGEGSDGQLGTAKPLSNASTPQLVAWLDDAARVDAGGAFSCALRATGVAVCWGHGRSGELGDGQKLSSPALVAVTGLDAVRQVSAGLDHACALHGERVACWGSNDRGQLGSDTSFDQARPLEVPGLPAIAWLEAGHQFSCAASGGSSPRVWCWGQNASGQLGDGTRASRREPVEVSFLEAMSP